MSIELKKMKRALAILLAMVMLFGQTELILPKASAAGSEDEPQQSGQVGLEPSADPDGGADASEMNGAPVRGGSVPDGDDGQPETLSIPLLPGPEGGQWTRFDLAERGFTLTIPAEGFTAGNYALGFALLSESSANMNFSFNYSISDESGEETACDQVSLSI